MIQYQLKMLFVQDNFSSYWNLKGGLQPQVYKGGDIKSKVFFHHVIIQKEGSFLKWVGA